MGKWKKALFVLSLPRCDAWNPPIMIRSAARNFAPGGGGRIETYKSAGLGFRVAKTLE